MTKSRSRGKDLHGHVVGFCGSAGKDDLSGIGSNQVCHLLLTVGETTHSFFHSDLEKIMMATAKAHNLHNVDSTKKSKQKNDVPLLKQDALTS